MKRLVVFDLDHTLLRTNCSYAFGSYLFRQKQINLWQVTTSLMDYMRHRWFGLSMNQLHKNCLNRFLKNFSVTSLHYLVKSFLNKNFEQLCYRPAIEKLKEAQLQGDYVLLLSSSPDFLVGPIAKKLGINYWASTSYQLSLDGYLSALLHVMDGKQKALYLTHQLKILNFFFKSLVIYSDSYLDLPLLLLANEAIGVNPDKQLKHLCLKNKWPII